VRGIIIVGKERGGSRDLKMAAVRSRVPPYMILLVAAFVLVGVAGFQTLKERKNANAVSAAKENETGRLKSQFEVDLESYKKKLVRLGQENDKLSRQITELKHFRDIYEDSKKQLSACQEDRKKNVDTNRELCDEKDRKILSLQKDLQERDSWISIIKADPAKARGKIPEASKPVTKMLEEDADETVKSEQLSEAVQKEKVENQIYHGEGIQDDRGLASEEDSADSKVEADLEDSKVDADLEDTKAKTADLEESEQAATKVVGAEDEDDKDLENDSKMAAVDAVETNDKSAQE